MIVKLVPARIEMISVKQGVGKTTLSLYLGKEIAKLGNKVLIVNMDPLSPVLAPNAIERTSHGELFHDTIYGFTTLSLKTGNGDLRIINIVNMDTNEDTDLEEIIYRYETEKKIWESYIHALKSDQYDYFIINTPPTNCKLARIIPYEERAFETAHTVARKFKIYVSDFSNSTLRATLGEALRDKAEISATTIFIINKVYNFIDNINLARQELESIVKLLNGSYGIIIPIYRELLIRQNHLIGSDIEIHELKKLAEIIVKDSYRGEDYIMPKDPAEAIASLITTRRSILVKIPARGIDHRALILGIIKRLAEEKGSLGVKKAGVILTKKDIYEAFNDTKGYLKYNLLLLLPTYREDRFNAKSIYDIIRVGKKLATEIAVKLPDSNVIVIYRGNDLIPMSKYSDIRLQENEFWGALIGTLRNRYEIRIIVICESDAFDHSRCIGAEEYVDAIIDVDEYQNYRVRVAS
ncbi:MAG: ParA family protein [Sulfolobales archaeon]